jgi:hypothetical protein
MARRSREAVQKRLRERRRAEKSEQKRLKRLARKQGRTLDEEESAVPGEGSVTQESSAGEVVAVDEEPAVADSTVPES